MSKNHLIAVCDILGFKSLFNDNKYPLDWLYNKMGNISSSIAHSVYKDFYPFAKKLNKLRKISPLGIAWFSDTVLLFTREDTNEQVKEFISCVGYLVSDNMLFRETRLRAGISYGEAIMNDSNEIYIGKALIEAHELEKKQKWAGCALTESAERRILPLNNNEILNWLINYDVPIDENKFENRYVINWTQNSNHPENILWKGGKDQPTPEEEISEKEIVLKWRNTNKFHKDVCRIHKSVQ